MKWLKVAFASVVALSFNSAYAFHAGGVADCDGCHTMHNSFENKAVAVHPGNEGDINNVTNIYPGASTQFQGKNFLLQGSDTSSTCLNCHAGSALSSFEVCTYPFPAVGSSPVQRTPGGDFSWLTLTFSGSRGATVYGERHGHNIIAADFGLVQDTTQTVAPGGTYPASNLSCASCHDPHSRARIIDANGDIAEAKLGQAVLPIYTSGSYGGVATATAATGVYRLLGSASYTQMSLPGEVPFASNPPVAVAPSSYNQTEGVNEVRVAYGAGMSEWCANCHVSIHNGNTGAPSIGGANTALIHPAGNTALLTAAANDLGYENAFVYQLESQARTGDVLIAISSSGRSPNIVRALAWARDNGLRTIALTGFDGGAARAAAEVAVHVDCSNYGIVEDLHQAVLHGIAQYVRQSHMAADAIAGSTF